MQAVKNQPEAKHRLKELMDSHGLRSAELSRKTGLPQATLRYILQGLTDNPRTETIVKLADFFNVTVDFLLGRNEKAPALVKPVTTATKATARIPVLEWKTIQYWISHEEAVLPSDHKQWLPSDESLSPKSFALCTTYEGRGVFPKNSFIVVDPKHPFIVDDYVIAALDDNKPSIKRIWQEGAKQYMNPVGGNTPAIEIQDSKQILGTIVEYRMPMTFFSE